MSDEGILNIGLLAKGLSDIVSEQKYATQTNLT